MTTILTQDNVMQLLDSIYGQVIDGIPHVSKPIHVLATDYTTKYANDHTAAKKMINNQITKCTVSGVLSGIGGAIVLPVTIPIDVSSSLYVQMRMIACTAKITGYDLKDDTVQTLIYACLAGIAIDDLVKSAGIKAGEKFAVSMIKKIPGEIISKINQKVGFRFLTKFGETGVINLGKLVPGVGAIIGGGLNMAETKVIGDRAYKFFVLGDTSAMSEKKLNRVGYKVIPDDDTEKKSWRILSISSDLNIENHYLMENGIIKFVDVVCNSSELNVLRHKLEKDGDYLIKKLTREEYEFMLSCPNWSNDDII